MTEYAPLSFECPAIWWTKLALYRRRDGEVSWGDVAEAESGTVKEAGGSRGASCDGNDNHVRSRSFPTGRFAQSCLFVHAKTGKLQISRLIDLQIMKLSTTRLNESGKSYPSVVQTASEIA